MVVVATFLSPGITVLSAVLSWPTSVTAVPGLVQIIARGGCRSGNSNWPARSASVCVLNIAVKVAVYHEILSEFSKCRGINISESNTVMLSPKFWSYNLYPLVKGENYQNTDRSPFTLPVSYHESQAGKC